MPKRARERHRARRESPLSVDPPARAEADDWGDARALLDVELARLPAHYRIALVLCELQGVGRAEAAERLGVPEGTVSSRLARGKARLRARLISRGLTLSSAAVAGLLGESAAVGAAQPLAASPSAAAVSISQMEVPTMTGSLIGKLGLALLTTLSLSIAALWLAAPPEAKPEPPVPVDPAEVADLKAMQGEWQVMKHSVGGELRLNPPGASTITIKGHALTFAKDMPEWSFIIYPHESPKQIDMVRPPDGPKGTHPFGAKVEGIYRIEGKQLILALDFQQGGGAKRPQNFNNAPKSERDIQVFHLSRPGAGIDTVVNEKRPPMDPAIEKKAIQGVWKTIARRGGYEGMPPFDGKRTMELTANTMGGSEGTANRYVIYPNENPPQFDKIVFLKGENHGYKQEAIYRLDGDTLTIHWAALFSGKDACTRPTGFTPIRVQPGQETTVVTYQRVKN